jgi:hypothetical protein
VKRKKKTFFFSFIFLFFSKMSESKALRSWTDDEAANRALPVDFNAPENAEAKRRFQLMTRDLHSWIDPQLIW